MVDSLLVLFRLRFAAARPCRRKTTQFFACSVDQPEIDGGEADDPVAILGFGDADGLPGERLADENKIAAPLDLAGGPDPPGRVIRVVPWRRDLIGGRSRRRMITADRWDLPERFVLLCEAGLSGILCAGP